MKNLRNIFLALFVIASFASLALSNNDEFFSKEKYWLLERNYMFYDKKELYKIVVDEEVEIEGVKAHKLRRDWVESGMSETAYYAYEEDGVIYVLWYDVFYPVMNFKAAVGDELPIWDTEMRECLDSEAQTIYGEEFLSINGKIHRLLYLSPSLEPENAWIEGIGASKEINSLILVPSAACFDTSTDHIIGCYRGDECLYLASELDSYRGLSAIEEITGSAAEFENEPLYDLMGRRVERPQSGRIYVSPSGKRLWR